MAQEDRFSAFYPMIIYPEHEQAARLREMSGHLQTMVRDLSRTGQNQPQTQIVQVQSQDQDASHQMVMSIDDLRESLGRDLGGLRNELGGLSSQLEWSIGLLHDSIVEQTDVLLTIAKQQRIPTELKVSEYLTGAQEMMHQLTNDIQSNRLDQNQIEQKFTAIDSRFIEAMDPLPRAGLMYAILLARTELYLLVKKDNEALVFLEESLIYAPRDDSFDYNSYSYRLMGRIVFTQGNSLKAKDYLDKATDLSPRYAIAWYDRAQYLAQSVPINGADMATRALRRAIEMNDDFMLLASIEPNFNPIRKEVDALILTIRLEKAAELKRRTDDLRKSHLATCNQLQPQIEKVRVKFSGGAVWEKESIGKELALRIKYPHPITKDPAEGCASSVLSLRERVIACKNLVELQALCKEVTGLSDTCSQLLETLEVLKKFWKDLPQQSRQYFETSKKILLAQQDHLAKLRQELANHERQKPRVSRRMQKYSGLDYGGIQKLVREPLPWFYLLCPWMCEITSGEKDQLKAELYWKEKLNKLQPQIEPFDRIVSGQIHQMTVLTELIRKFELIDIP